MILAAVIGRATSKSMPRQSASDDSASAGAHWLISASATAASTMRVVMRRTRRGCTLLCPAAKRNGSAERAARHRAAGQDAARRLALDHYGALRTAAAGEGERGRALARRRRLL